MSAAWVSENSMEALRDELYQSAEEESRRRACIKEAAETREE